MSVKAMSAAFDAGDGFNLSAIDRLILLRIGDWADDYGYAFPGIDDLVAKVGVDERTIRRHLSSMDRKGLILRVYGGGGRHRTTLYRILPGFLPDAEDAPGRRRYESRYGVDTKGGRESAFLEGKGGPPGHEMGTGQVQKGGQSYDPRSVSIHQYPSDDLSIPKQEPGESMADYLARIHSLLNEET